jgi:site-specific DNA recombinase
MEQVLRRKLDNNKNTEASIIRCAIYTRKSTNEGLDQEFNSLNAQREAAEAYIASQKHEGWVCLPECYDDGGFSGGTMERPAIKRLMSDIEAGAIDCIVVYKVDRLSRSLLDFARLVGTFEQHNVSFVSVTQQFNTTNSMGRLTLNILLSFAQFEREIIAERTRDKMSAARRKGKWVGGHPVLGYNVAPGGGRLIVNEEEAAKVQIIFELYLERQSLIATVQELNRRRWTTKSWITKKGREHIGKPFNKNKLFDLLTNIIYLGKVNHKGTIYEGEHEAIVSEEIWRNAQNVLRRNGKNGGKLTRNKYGALLRSLLYCIPCNAAMIHSYTSKSPNRRYRYYVCSKAQKHGWSTCPTKSLPAAEIERFVVERIRCIGKDHKLIAETIEQTQAQHDKQFEKLGRERRILELELKRYHNQLHHIIGSGDSSDSSNSPTTNRLADLQEQINNTEQKLTNIREETIRLNQQTVGEQELTTALSQFDPIWESLSPREQARVIHLLVERIGYDGEKGTVALTFRNTGIKTLAQELNISNEA